MSTVSVDVEEGVLVAERTEMRDSFLSLSLQYLILFIKFAQLIANKKCAHGNNEYFRGEYFLIEDDGVGYGGQ